ncbi:AAA family ATPase [Sinomicrobium kalidii]|uniref:AAA family ATPase n=1 Tax=Sinomicrobium kalidii TaxID=2900738 RepID=UPI001E6310D7|nr:AAA family ATPase [Sinomicrobium kalidii]UGU15182.1 AAA family ATPase [Sinomicrobium kalidii]
MMNTQQKELITSEIAKLAKKGSQSKVARKAGVSAATISQIVNHNWKLIRPELWQKIQVNLRIDHWKTAETSNFKMLNELLQAVQTRSLSIGISHEAGVGKSHAYKHYERYHKNVIYVECRKYWSQKSYVKNLLLSCGLDIQGTTEELIEAFIAHVKTLYKPVIIQDQSDKLKDPPLDLFMDFYNELFGHCAFVLSGVPAFKKRILKGVQRDKIGFRELWSRINRKFIPLDPTTLNDVRAICQVNGLYDEDVIHEIYNTCEGDLRRVRQSVEQYFLLHENKAA